MKAIIPLFLLISLQTFAQKPDSSKNTYHLFRPTPRNLMRSMETDRPDITESAYSVDAGHFQLETDLFKQVLNRTNGTYSRQYFYNLANLKIGISNSSDLQLVIENYVVEKTTDQNANISRKSGFGQLSFRYKQNIWGNDGGKTALSFMPYIKLPNGKFAESNTIEFGFIFPFAMELSNSWGMGAQAQLDFLKADSGYQHQLLNSITFAKDIGKSWNTFVESYYTYLFEEQIFSLSANGGVSYTLSSNLKIDAGFNLGLTKNTDKVYFTGISFRY